MWRSVLKGACSSDCWYATVRPHSPFMQHVLPRRSSRKRLPLPSSQSPHSAKHTDAACVAMRQPGSSGHARVLSMSEPHAPQRAQQHKPMRRRLSPRTRGCAAGGAPPRSTPRGTWPAPAAVARILKQRNAQRAGFVCGAGCVRGTVCHGRGPGHGLKAAAVRSGGGRSRPPPAGARPGAPRPTTGSHMGCGCVLSRGHR